MKLAVINYISDMSIYKLTCKTTGKSYVGQTKHTSRYRWNQHVWEANHPDVNQSRKLNNAILKYTPDDFIIEDIWECTEDELDLWEEVFIEKYKTFENGLNLTKGGKKNQVISNETREKLSKALKGKPKNVKDNRKRVEDWILPKYLKHYIDTKCEGYKVSDHPKLDGNDSISFTRSDQTMQEKFMQAMEVLDSLNNGTYVHEKKKEPRGVQPIPDGYRVRIKGHSVKTFQNKKYTMEEKLQMATNYADNIYKGVQFND